MFIGVFDYNELYTADRIIAPVFFLLFMLLFTYILANIFIAILENAYEKVHEGMIGEESDEPNFISSII
jgi:hypothetical protein